MQNSDMRSNPAFQNLSPEKLQFIMNFMGQEKSGNSREMMAMLMAFSGRAKQEGIQFSSSETDFIIQHLMESMNPSEKRQAELILNMMRRR